MFSQRFNESKYPRRSNKKRLWPSAPRKRKPPIKIKKIDALLGDKAANSEPVTKAAELDKFKRRLIRAVARLLLVEKKPEEEVWSTLKKETGCDCQLLWLRMRSLTMKKLHRLFVANDNVMEIPKVARMSFTDWLLFDLVLVHQKIDVIGQDNPDKHDPKPLVDLFGLVKEFRIEGRRCESLAAAWSAATLKYNSHGHQCSPMLLQLRWYQLKEVTRDKFYNFWYTYRGTAKRLSLAEPHTPTPLQAAIATEYKHIVTKPFLEWEELIQMRMVTLPDEFERKMLERSTQRVPEATPSEETPDLVVIEPQIETIDLRLESDSEKETDEVADKTQSRPETPIKIKEEPMDMDMDIEETRVEEPPKKSMYEVVLESTAIEYENIDNVEELGVEENVIKETIKNTFKLQEPALPQITSVFGNVSDTSVLADNNTLNTVDDIAVLSNIDADISRDLANRNETPILAKDDTTVFDSVDDAIVLAKDNETTLLDSEEDAIGIAKDDDVTDLDSVDNAIVLAKDNDTTLLDNEDDAIVLAKDNDTTLHDSEDNTVVIAKNNDTTLIDSEDDAIVLAKDNDTTLLDNEDDAIVLAKDNDTTLHDSEDNTVVIAKNNDTTLIDSEDDAIVLAKDNDTTLRDSEDDGFDLAKDDDTALVNLDNTNIVNEDDSINISDTDDILVDKSNTLTRSDALSRQAIEITDTGQDAETFESVTTTDSCKDIRDENTQNEAMNVSVKTKIKEYTPLEPFNASNINEDAVSAEDIVNNKLKTVVKREIITFSYSEMSSNVSFVDDGIEFVDDGIAYHDDDSNDETSDDEIKDIQKIDPKLLMCPVIYTTKLDDMGLLHTTAFAHVEGKQLLDDIMLKSKPRKTEPAEEDSSETNDSSDDEVTDNQRVKLSSYLLQKPRSRSYNPIQLCKNPDFNTRLKRLTVGFFSSPRNRGLIKSCKPLTIDLSKAFESKMISGTLYLKPSDQDIKQEIIIDDTESRQSVTVVPSAMPAQSLIDNSKIGDILPLLQSSSVSPKPPDEFSSTCERNKVINLPDISEIRRINQRLLTAEVSPIQVQNCRPQVPVSIVSPTQTATAQSVDVRGPPSIVDVTKDSPAIKNTESSSSTDNSLTAFETNKSVRRQCLDSFYGRCSGRGRKKIGPPILWKSRQTRPQIPWFSKTSEVPALPSKVEETLLTLDTLNKMLYLLCNDNEEPKSKQIKQKKMPKRTAQPKSSRKEIRETQDDQTELTQRCAKLKINIKSAVNDRCKKQQPAALKAGKVTLDDHSESDTEQSKKSDQHSDENKKDIKYCCWARQRMLQMLFSRKHIPPHPCPYRVCTCCCRTLLEEYIINDLKLKKARMKDKSTTADFEICEDVATDTSKNVVIDTEASMETPDSVLQEGTVQVEVFDDSHTPTAEPPVLDVGAIQDKSTSTVMDKELIDIDALELQDGVPTLGGEVCVATTAVVPPALSSPQPNPDIPIDVCINITGPRITPYGPKKRKATISQPQLHSTPQVVVTSTPTLRKVLAVKKAATPNTLGYNMPAPRNPKPFTPKNFKEKMIFLNSKQISDNPAENPIFLGKNKILLTTIKFPPNLKKFEEAKRTLKSSLKIPNGVQLICLPNGSVTYTINHNVEVNATDLASMPVIISKLQAEINKPNPLVEVPKVAVNEVVNLIDDDDVESPKDKEIINNEISSETKFPTILIDGTGSTTDSPHHSSHIETEENGDHSNQENNTDITTEIPIEESNPNIDAEQNAGQNAVTIQGPVQELSQTETPTTSAEHDQPAASSTEVCEEGTSEPCKINKSKNILSDLMEMSGIFEEDITPSPEEILAAEATQQQVVMANASELAEVQEVMTTNASESVAEEPNVVPITYIDSTKQSPPVKHLYVMPTNKLYENNVPPVIKSPFGDLSPITSLYELKYACMNNGIFFKLDFSTGYLVPINVCMKQQPKPVTKPIDTKSVIDLTEDDTDKGRATTLSTSDKSSDKRSLLISNNASNESVGPSKSTIPAVATSSSSVKPIKLFRAVKPPILLRRISQGVPTTSDKVTNLNQNADHKSKRKQFIRTVDLINTDSDTAMAKQPAPKLYCGKKKRKIDDDTTKNDRGEDCENKAETTSPELSEKQTELEIGSDDSSDEEPLSNLAKRKRENVAHPEQKEELQSHRQNEMGKADLEDVHMSYHEPAELETHYELILEKSMAEEEEEQCILGV